MGACVCRNGFVGGSRRCGFVCRRLQWRHFRNGECSLYHDLRRNGRCACRGQYTISVVANPPTLRRRRLRCRYVGDASPTLRLRAGEPMRGISPMRHSTAIMLLSATDQQRLRRNLGVGLTITAGGSSIKRRQFFGGPIYSEPAAKTHCYGAVSRSAPSSGKLTVVASEHGQYRDDAQCHGTGQRRNPGFPRGFGGQHTSPTTCGEFDIDITAKH